LHEPKLHLRQFWPEATVHLNYRPDIDGLRAIAIVFVLMFHAAPAALPGGFIGVDMFFVISGYLITRMILVDLARRSFSLLAFYGRRIRRLFPALIIVIAAVWLFGHVGDGNVHVNVTGVAPDDERIDDAVFRLVASSGGSISAEHGIGTAKKRWLALARSPAEISAFRAIKGALDPGGILNPNVLVAPPASATTARGTTPT